LAASLVNGGALFVAVFLACAVEAVEATTIVLAAGTARSWKAAMQGTAAGLALLAVLIAALGPALSSIPLRGLRAFVGGLLLILGLQWLRKAVLRASGHKSLRDEDKAYEEEVAAARNATLERRGIVPDWYAFVLSFKGVVLEGLEVAFIVLTFGANQHDIPLAAIAAISAAVIVAAVGFAVKSPLSRVPENTLKFVVGVMLTSFGMFWGAEGAGANWPGGDAALLVIVPGVALLSLGLAGGLRRSAPAVRRPAAVRVEPTLAGSVSASAGDGS
jgi:uncharacterized membrane protein